MRHLDLFSGIGGFTLAASHLGITTTQFVEINPDAQTVLRDNFPGIPIHSDIREYHPKRGEFELITCGFPCTGTSNAGKREGLKHPASALWREGIRCLIECRARFCVIEQPQGVVRRGLRAILGALRMAGYAYEAEIITAQELGAGHPRPRLFIISYPDQWCKHFQQPPCWTNQVRKVVERQRLDSEWLTVRDLCSCQYNGLSVRLVQGLNEILLEECHYTEPTNTPGRIRARYLAGRSVTPAQAAVALRRVKYLNQIRR